MSLIKKEIPISILEISKQVDKSTLWLNSIDQTIIRISNVNFYQDFDKFNFIDIDCKSGKGIVYNNYNNLDEQTDEIRKFLILLNQAVINEIYGKKVNFNLISKLLKVIKENEKNE